MTRADNSTQRHKRDKKILRAAKGYRGRRRSTLRVARQAVERAGQYAYRDRRQRKRTWRALWIQRINAAARENGLTYGRFMNALRRMGVEMDRKILADLAVREPRSFKALAEEARKAIASQ